MQSLEILKKTRDDAHEAMKIVDKALPGIIKAIHDSDPAIDYAKAVDVASSIGCLLFDHYFDLERRIETAEKMEAEK